MSRTERLFDLLDRLRTRRHPVTAAELAGLVGVSCRSIYRDIGTLRSMGAPIDGDAGVGYRLRPGFFLPPTMLTPDEIDALTLGASWVRQRADPALAAAAESAIAKIAAIQDDGSAPGDRLPALVTAARSSAPVDPGWAAVLRQAIRAQRKLDVVYRDGEGRQAARVLWPVAIAYFDDVRILAAWCELREGFRHFRLDRLTEVKLRSDRYPGRRGHLVRQWREQDRMQGLRS